MKCLSEIKAQIEAERACLHQQLLNADNITQCCVQSHKLDRLLEEYYRILEEAHRVLTVAFVQQEPDMELKYP